MKKPRVNPRLVKIHRNYAVSDVTELLHVHRNTVREWLRQGLKTIDDRRPALVLGSELRAFLEERRRRARRPLLPGQVYCVRCREARKPADGTAEYYPRTETLGDLVGACSSCGTHIYRRVNLASLPQIRGELDVRFPQASPRLGETDQPSLNSAFKAHAGGCVNAQRCE